MRNKMILSALGLLVAATSGCVNCGNPCGSWRPGSMLGLNKPPAPVAAQVCCDPCGGQTMGLAPVAAPVAVAAPCCQ
jgi:hypothetical protein